MARCRFCRSMRAFPPCSRSDRDKREKERDIGKATPVGARPGTDPVSSKILPIRDCTSGEKLPSFIPSRSSVRTCMIASISR